jgi:hypothetical protein
MTQVTSWPSSCCADGHHLFDIKVLRGGRNRRCRCGKWKGLGKRNKSAVQCLNCRQKRAARIAGGGA